MYQINKKPTVELETCNYVDEILERYEHYRNIIPDQDRGENGNA